MMEERDEDIRMWQSPSTILYRQIDRFLILKVSGRGAADAMRGMMGCISSIRDTEYKSDIEKIRLNGGGDWDIFEAITQLLKRKNLWLQPPRGLVKGAELLGAID